MGRGPLRGLESVRRIEDVDPKEPDKIPESFIDNLDEFRASVLSVLAARDRNMSDLARAIGRSRQFVHQVLIERIPFGVQTAKRISVALSMDLCLELRAKEESEKRECSEAGLPKGAKE